MRQQSGSRSSVGTMSTDDSTASTAPDDVWVPPPWEPPLAGTELEHLLGSLARLRATFRWKADGLDEAGLAQRLGPSPLTPGGPVPPPAVCGEHTFTTKTRGGG